MNFQDLPEDIQNKLKQVFSLDSLSFNFWSTDIIVWKSIY
jgi:hypothetical protein